MKHPLEILLDSKPKDGNSASWGTVLSMGQLRELASELAVYRAGLLAVEELWKQANSKSLIQVLFTKQEINQDLLGAYEKALELAKK